VADSIIFGDIVPVPSTSDANHITLSVLGEVPNPTFAILYKDVADSDKGKGNVGSVNGEQITYGSSYQFNEGCQDLSSSRLPTATNDKFVFARREFPTPYHGEAQCGTVSGTTISYGDKTDFSAVNWITATAIESLTSSGFVVAWVDNTDSNTGKMAYGSIDGTTITYGDVVEFSDVGVTSEPELTSLSSSGFVIAYRKDASSGNGQVRIGSVSGTTITLGDPSGFHSSGTATYLSLAPIDADRCILAFKSNADSGHSLAKIITVSGTDPTYGIDAEFYNGNGGKWISCDTFNGSSCVAAYSDVSTNGEAKIGTISGTNIVWGSGTTFTSRPIVRLSCSAFFGDRFVCGWHDAVDDSAASGLTIFGRLPDAMLYATNETTLYIEGSPAPAPMVTGSATLYIFNGPKLVTNAATLFLQASIEANDNRDLYIAGRDIETGSAPLFIEGHGTETQSATLFLHGLETITEVKTLFIEGSQSSTASATLFIEGLATLSASRTLYIRGGNDVTGSTTLYIEGHDSVTAVATLFIGGTISTTGTVDLFIGGQDVDSASSDLFIHGHQVDTASATLYIGGQGLASGSSTLVIVGASAGSVNATATLYIAGTVTAAVESGTVTLFINGFEPKPSPACPILDPTAVIQIKSSLITTYQQHIDALINQLGKNVLLEFDPIRSPCPNCTYDTQRKRSTGIYIPGGPRPFKRKRKCPWCKGRGLLETAVNKCIKCLVQWNPEDAEKYGISVEKQKGIVRLKTFLTEADDLRRARTVLSNYDIAAQMQLRVKLVAGPIPVGLREDRYCISFWELI